MTLTWAPTLVGASTQLPQKCVVTTSSSGSNLNQDLIDIQLLTCTMPANASEISLEL